jgi:uncharacterized OB-fold protein
MLFNAENERGKMENELSRWEPLVHESQINVPYEWWAGETAGRFFKGIRDEQKIFGTECTQCNKVFVPPRKSCPECFAEKTTWVEVGPEGELVAFTVARRQLAALPKKAPVIFGLIRLDGADTALLHRVGEVKPGKVQIGMRLAAKFSDTRKGGILDIDYFRPA